MGLPIVSGATSDLLTVDTVSKAARVTIYDTAGNVITPADRGTLTPGTSRGMPLVGIDGGIARLIRASSDGSLRASDDTCAFYDSTEGAAVDTNKWIQTTTTQTITQTAGTGILFNAGSSVATTTGAQHVSHTRFPFLGRNGIAFRCRARATAHFNNSLIELGFGSPASVTGASIGDGAVWRKDGTGQWVPVVSINGAEALGNPISNSAFTALVATTDYAHFEVFLEESRATFRIQTAAGAVVNEQVVNFGATIGTFTATHLSAMLRHYNSGATGTAVQLFVAQSSVWYTDMIGPTWEQVLAGMNYGSLTSPTAYTQLANFTNNTQATNATLSNTTAGYTTLGGKFTFVAPAGAETDYALFGVQIPAPYGFTVTRVLIDAVNTGAAVATTATVIEWGLAFNSSAVSLATAAPYTPMRKAIGSHTWPIGAAIGASGGAPVVWQGREKVQPGRFFHVIARVFLGTATASQVLRGSVTVDGFFE